MTPVALSKVSNENESAQGTLAVRVSWIWPRISPRIPEIPALENGRLPEEIWPLVTVNVAGEPIATPLAFRNEMLPVHEAAVPLVESEATLTTLMRAVSVLPSPAGGRLMVRVPVVDVCANSDSIEPEAISEIEISLWKRMLTRRVIANHSCRMNLLLNVLNAKLSRALHTPLLRAGLAGLRIAREQVRRRFLRWMLHHGFDLRRDVLEDLHRERAGEAV